MTRGSSHGSGQIPRQWQGVLVLSLALMLISVVHRAPVAAFTLGTSGTALTLKLTITASGLSGTITAVSVQLIDVTADHVEDLDLLLIHPNGSNNLLFMSDSTNGSADNFTGSLTISDSGATCLPRTTSITADSTYRPADYGSLEALSNWANLSTEHPALTITPAGGSGGSACSGAAGTGTFASAFGGLTANGTWEVWIKDDTGGAPAISMSRIRLAITTTTGSATVANVESFTAMPSMDGGAQLAWRTGFEVDNLGFNVYRDDDGQRTMLNPSVIAGSALLVGPGTALTAGHSYVWWDTSAPVTPNTQYWLEDIDLSGQRTLHGPVAIDRSAQAISPPPTGQGQAALLRGLGRAAAQQRLTPVTRRATLSTPSAGLSPRQPPLAAQSAVKLLVREEGWYRVTQAELVAAGLDPDVDPRLLQLHVDGHEVPILMAGQEDGQFAQGDTLEFYGRGQDVSWTDTRVYWLVVGAQPGQRIARVSALGGQPADDSFPYMVERKDRTVYFSSLRNGERENFFGAVVSSEPIVETLLVSYLDAAPSGTPSSR